MAQRTENRLVRAGARSASGRFALRVGRDLRDLEVVDRGMTLAAHVFTSILPILIVVGALRATLDPQADAIFAEHLGFSDATAEMLEKSLPAGARELRVIGVVGVVVLVIAATSFARALERSFQTIWRTPKVSIKFAWRWLVAIVAVVIGTRAHRRDAHHRARRRCDPRDRVHRRGRDLGCAVVDRGVDRDQPTREPSSAPARRSARRGRVRDRGTGGRVVLPPILAEAALRFGILGVAFSYIGWLLVLSCILLIAVTAGRVVYLTSTRQVWRRS